MFHYEILVRMQKVFVNLSLKIVFASHEVPVVHHAVRYSKFHKFGELLQVVRGVLLPEIEVFFYLKFFAKLTESHTFASSLRLLELA